MTLTLRDFLARFLEFRVAVVERRARHRLGRAAERAHLVDGFLTAMDQLDAVVKVGLVVCFSMLCGCVCVQCTVRFLM